MLLEIPFFCSPYQSITFKGSGKESDDAQQSYIPREQHASADVLMYVGNLESPLLGAEVTLKAASQTVFNLHVCQYSASAL